ncbi:NAD(P)/FAD-dependent oxidoreductase [candidate division KSB1 bacterium]|nr:NAD(P)/FAD-dependent oxidoreductase [candidate division KSB1 bacterium]
MDHLVIIGNGITGITTARHVRKLSNKQITIISNESDHFYSRPALMYIFMGHMRYSDTKPYEDWFWQKNTINLVRGFVTGIDTDQSMVHLNNDEKISYDQLLIATGSKPNKFGWPGQDLPGVQGFYGLPDLELLEKNCVGAKRAVIVGGGLIGIEFAEMLLSRHIAVTMLVREESYWNNILPQRESELVSRHIREHGIDLRCKVNLKELVPGSEGRVQAVITDNGEEIPCEIVGLTPGVSPNIELAKNSKIATNRGVLVNEFLETNIRNVYAAGDCAEITESDSANNKIEQLWYTGRMQGMALAKTLCGERTPYNRGIWFNSAKFLDIEYQTYGYVSNIPRDGEDSFYWEHPDDRKCLHLVYEQKSHALLGMNVFGIRMRHRVFEAWIREKRSLEYVLENLGEADFDPEFYREFEREIVALYNRQFPEKNLHSRKKRGLLNFL